MKIIEKPVQQIEKGEDLKQIMFVIVALMKSLKNIYDNSNFYREARIVSFVDRLLQAIVSKFKARFSFGKSVYLGISDQESYQEQLGFAESIIDKFIANFFINVSTFHRQDGIAYFVCVAFSRI